MEYTHISKLTLKGLDKALVEISDRVNAGKEEQFFATSAESLDFADIKALADAANKLAEDSPNDLTLRFELLHWAATYRDALYAHASGRYLRGLGVHNQMRGLYERGKAKIDSEVPQA